MRSAATVPIHLKPIVDGGRVLAKMERNRRCDRLHLHKHLDYSRVEVAADVDSPEG
ncbi:MAG: hypothetical protein U9O50_00220 [Acidobacteriota bacterium]|nr:hypothetical protein [Acidobacteriota bacterium]